MNNLQYTKVWDPFVRVFHWALVAAFIVAYITEDDLMGIHSWAGYIVMALVSARIVWGFIGTRHARFSDFVFSASTIKQYLKDIVQLNGRRYLGHNPAGGAMVILLLLSLLLTSVSGLLVYGAEEGAGPLAAWFSPMAHDEAEIFEEAHEFFANFTLFLILLHVAGVLLESLIHGENLITAMFNGKKQLRDDDAVGNKTQIN